MSNIKKAFEKKKAFIPFITCGDPDLETTEKTIRAMVENGADLIELGIPFSDPTAEGPVIQEANIRALSAGTTTDKVFDLVRKLRQDITVPFVFMTYVNVFFHTVRKGLSQLAMKLALTVLFCLTCLMKKKKIFYLYAKNMMLTLFHLLHRLQTNVLL